MRFLRLLINALLCGLFVSGLMALLVLDLNVNAPFRPGTFLGLTAFLFPFYGLLAALACVVVAAIFHFLTGRKKALPLVSGSFLTLGFSLLTLGFLVVFRENDAYFASFFTPAHRLLLRMQMVALFGLTAAGLILHYNYRHRRPHRAYLGAFFLLAAAAVGLSVVARWKYPAPPVPSRLPAAEVQPLRNRITVLRLEGLSPEFLLPLVREGKLPNTAFLMKTGSAGPLAGFTPSDPYLLRRSFETGKFPARHRDLSEVGYAMPLVSPDLDVVPRFVLFRQLSRTGLLRLRPREAGPGAKGLWAIFEEAGAAVQRWEGDGPAAPGGADPAADKAFEAVFKDFRFDASPLVGRARQAFARDYRREELAFQAKAAGTAQAFILALDGLAEVETYFYKFAVPESFGALQEDEIQRYGAVIERTYEVYDRLVGKWLATLKDDELFVVYSPFGVAPQPFWKRLVEWALGNAAISADHERAPDGFFFLGGPGIAAGASPDGVRLVDLAPAILYASGLPVGRDMDGFVRSELFAPEFKERNPILTISSYEAAGRGAPGRTPAP